MKINKLIIIFIIFLLIATGVSLFSSDALRKKIILPVFKGTAKHVILKLDSSVDEATVGKQFTIDLYFASDTLDISSFDAVVTYDPEILRVDEIKGSDIFPFYPRKMIEDFKNRFVVTGVQKSLKSELKVKAGVLAQILVTPLRAGKAEFQFMIDGDKYTNVMNRALENVLKDAMGVEVGIKEQ